MVDFNAVDVLLLFEESLGLECDLVEMNNLVSKRKSCDVTMQEIMDLINRYPPVCQKCKYDLRGHVGVGQCPECGTPFDLCNQNEDGRWQTLREIVSSNLKIPIEQVQPDKFLFKDLMGIEY